jgi:alpha-ribazole phosphatase
VRLFLIRHPRPLLADGICYGRLDVAAEDPQPVAARLRPLLPAGAPVISSPLQRTRRLAAALHPQPSCDERLLEIDFGEWEGRPWERIERGLLDAWASDVLHFVPPGGESVAMLQARAIDCVGDLCGSDCALVTHAGVIRVLLGHWLQLPLGEWSRLPLDFGSITLLELVAGNGRGGLPAGAILHYLNRRGAEGAV